jgi:integrase
VFTYIPDWLRDRLLACVERHGQRPFITGRSERLETVTNIWRRRIARAFAAAGPFEEPPTPHRFRHTFARLLLQKGVPVADVADLLGDYERRCESTTAGGRPSGRNGSRGFCGMRPATDAGTE